MNYVVWIIAIWLVASVPVNADEVKPDGFRNSVKSLLAKYCVDCHGEQNPEGKLSLHAINPDLFETGNLETWRMIYEQVRFNDMPPKDADQPSQPERKSLLSWIRGEMLKTQLPGVVADQKLLLPEFGNYVDHEFLFETRLPRVYPAAPRIWRLRPDIYNNQMRNTRLAEGQDSLANGLSVRDGSAFKDFAATYFIDEAGMTPLLGNAKKLAAAMLDQKRGKNRELKALTNETEPPNSEMLSRAVLVVFGKAIGRKPTTSEHLIVKAHAEHASYLDDSFKCT